MSWGQAMQEPAGWFSHQELLGRVPASLAGRELHPLGANQCRLPGQKAGERNHEEIPCGLPKKYAIPLPGHHDSALPPTPAGRGKKDCDYPHQPTTFYLYYVFHSSRNKFSPLPVLGNPKVSTQVHQVLLCLCGTQCKAPS